MTVFDPDSDNFTITMTNLSKQRELFDWLHNLDLSHHFDHFIENGYEDLDICREIGESDLLAIGVCDIHERISLLQAIRYSRQVHQTTTTPTTFTTTMESNSANSNSRDRDNYISTNYNYQECDEEPFYESVLPFESSHDYEAVPECRSSGGTGGVRNSEYSTKSSGRIVWPNTNSGVSCSTMSKSSSSRLPHSHPHPHLPHNSSNSLHANLIPRTQLRDQVRQDGINISHVRNIPDEVTLGAMAMEYASELHGLSSSSQNAGEFLTFEQEIHHQLREMWFEERRKLVSQQGSQQGGFPSALHMHSGGSESPVRRLVTRGTTGTGTFASSTNNFSSSSRNTTSTNSRKTTSVPSGSSSTSTFGKKNHHHHQHHPVPVPTVSGIVSSGNGSGGIPSYSGADRLVDAMTCHANAMRSPEHRPPHQYLQHVIISNENLGNGGPLSNYSHPLAGAHLHNNSMQGDPPIYTPGIYLPSSCLLDKDEIYDYAPPLQQRNYSSPSKRSLQSPFKSKAKSKTSLSCYHGASQTSPSRRHYATIRNCSNNKSMSRSVSLHANHSSPTYVNTSALMSGDFTKSSSSPATSSSSHGCRTLTNLSRLSRRLGLSRFFRTFRTHGGSSTSQNSKLMTMSTTTTSTTVHGKPSRSNRQLVSSSSPKNQDDEGTSPCTLSSLPSNERIIETINRLKYEELQKRKERIAQEHQMILKELKNSMSPSTNSSDGPSSIFYVSNENSNGGTEEDEEVGAGTTASVSSPHHSNPHQNHQQFHTSYYEDPPYENESHPQTHAQTESSFTHKNSKIIHVNTDMGSKHSKTGSVSESVTSGMGKERRSWTTEYTEPGNYHLDRDPASNRTSSSSNYHSNSTSDSISSSGEVGGLGLEPENISCVGDVRKSRNCRGENPPCETLSSSTGGDSSTSSSNTGSSSRGSQTEHFSQQHLQEQNQHLRLSPTTQQFQEESENSFPQSKSLFGKVKELGSKSRRRFSHKHSSGSLHNGAPANDSSQPSSLNFNNFDEVRKSMGEGHGEEDNQTTTTNLGNEMTTSTSTSGYTSRTKAVDIIVGHRNSSEEELISITNSQSGGLGSLSLSETEEYLGPFVGKAVALVDCVPSPYDRHALRYKKGDLIEIISKKPTGLWTGKVNGQVGHFKFINVEILPPDESEDEDAEDGEGSNVYDRSGDHRGRQPGHSYLHVRRRNKRMTAMTPWEMEQRQTVANVINGIRKENAALSQHSKSLDSESPFRAVSQSRREGGGGRRKSSSVSATSTTAASLKKGRPKSVSDVLRRINLEEYISVFILHGFESLDLFKELEEEDLDRLSIRNSSDRAKILTVVELLREFDSEAEIPPIIIPTYSCPSQLDGIDDEDLQDRESDLHRIIAPPANFTRTAGSKISNATMVRDSGVFVKCDDQEDPEIEEIILSPVNLRIDLSPNRNFEGGATNNPIFLGRLADSNSGHGKQFHLHPHPMSQMKNPNNQIETQESMTAKANELWPDNVEQYCAVRQRFLQAKSLFESGVTSPGGTPQNGSDQSQKNRFLFCEKSSDSGISVGANSPPPLRID